MAAATSSLPVPDSPVISTPESLGATRAMSSATRRIGTLGADEWATESEFLAQRLGGCARLAELEGGGDGEQHRLRRQWLLEKIERAQLGGAHRIAQSCPPAHHDDREIGVALAELGQRGQAVQRAGHHEIEQHDVGCGVLRGRDGGDSHWARRAPRSPSATSSAPTMRRIFGSSSTIRTDAITTSRRQRGVLGSAHPGLRIARCALGRHR